MDATQPPKAKGSLDFAQSRACTAAHRVADLMQALDRLPETSLSKPIREALAAELKEVSTKAWTAYSASPTYRLTQLQRLLGAEPKR